MTQTFGFICTILESINKYYLLYLFSYQSEKTKIKVIWIGFYIFKACSRVPFDMIYNVGNIFCV